MKWFDRRQPIVCHFKSLPRHCSNYIFVHDVNAVKTRLKRKPLKESYWILARNPDRETKRWLMEYWKCSWWMQKASETLISLVQHVFAFLYVFISVSKVMSMIMFFLSLFFWSCRHLFLGTCCSDNLNACHHWFLLILFRSSSYFLGFPPFLAHFFLLNSHFRV